MNTTQKFSPHASGLRATVITDGSYHVSNEISEKPPEEIAVKPIDPIWMFVIFPPGQHGNMDAIIDAWVELAPTEKQAVMRGNISWAKLSEKLPGHSFGVSNNILLPFIADFLENTNYPCKVKQLNGKSIPLVNFSTGEIVQIPFTFDLWRKIPEMMARAHAAAQQRAKKIMS